MMIGLVLALCASAVAGVPGAWASLYDGRLSQSADHDAAAAIAIYETLLTHTPESDSMRGELLYWLGRARMSAGDRLGARETLASSAGYLSSRAQARPLLGRLIALDLRIQQLPYFQRFGLDTGPWVRGWNRGTEADLTWEKGPGGRVAAWRVEVVEGEDDFLTLALEVPGRVQRIRLRVWADQFPAHLRILLSDKFGRHWTAPVVAVPIGQWQQLDLPLNIFVPAAAPAASGRPNGNHLRWLELRDVTAFYSEDRGENRVFIDDLEVR